MITNTEEFNKQLMFLLCQNEDDRNASENENICLISKEPLQDDHVTLKCTHKFNYEPLVNELINQKQYSEQEIIQLKMYEVKCPYCRCVQKGVIPYNENSHIDKISGINWPPTKMYKGNKCSAILKSGKRKNQECGKACINFYCVKHIPKTNQIITMSPACNGCTVILKTGKRKGEKCNARCKISKPGDNSPPMCGRHLRYKKMKEQNNNIKN